MSKNNWWEDKAFTALRDKWYGKLSRKGFKDIEDNKGNLKLPGQTLNKNKAEYYGQIASMLHTAKWDHKVDKFVMEAVSQGWKTIEISRALKSKRLKCNVETVRLIIRKYESLWGVRKWTATK